MQKKTNIAEKRYKTYDLLSYALMNEPDKKLLAALEDASGLFKDLMDEDISFMKDMKLDDLKQEYYDRFFVSSSSLYVPPFEAAIRNMIKDSKEVKYGKLDSKETFHVEACYQMVEFEPNKLNMFAPLKDNTFPDHIAFEMAFMTFMANNEFISLKNRNQQFANNWNNIQRQFLEDHLSTWVDDYAKLVVGKGKGLYSYLVKLSSLWINLDLEYICGQ